MESGPYVSLEAAAIQRLRLLCSLAHSQPQQGSSAKRKKEKKRLSNSDGSTELTQSEWKCCCVMSGGIARGRLTEERKSWRKNHPHVRTTLLLLDSSFISKRCRFGVYFFFFFLLWFRVLLRSRRRCPMEPWIWWCGIALFPGRLGWVFLFPFYLRFCFIRLAFGDCCESNSPIFVFVFVPMLLIVHYYGLTWFGYACLHPWMRRV